MRSRPTYHSARPEAAAENSDLGDVTPSEGASAHREMVMTHDDPVIAKIINHVIELARKTWHDEALCQFIALYYERILAEDLDNYNAEELAHLARQAFMHIQNRQPGCHQIRTYRPSRDVHGFEAAVTIIEISNDDMPFLVDTVLGELSERALPVRVALHPLLSVRRDSKGGFAGFAAPGEVAADVYRESLIHVEIDRPADDRIIADLVDSLDQALGQNRVVVDDWPRMVELLKASAEDLQNNSPDIDHDELSEAVAFLDWLAEGNFTLLGIREYSFRAGGEEVFAPVQGMGLGILRDGSVHVLRRGREFVAFTPELKEFLHQPQPLIITKANVRARVHRRAYMDYIGIKQFDSDGAVCGEVELVGLFTQAAYHWSLRNIPLLRRKVAMTIERSGLEPDSYDGKALLNVLETYPRDELIQIGEQDLLKFSLGILSLTQRPRVRVFVRLDKFDRFVSVLVFVPRDRFNTDLRIRIGELLAERYQGRVSAFSPKFRADTLTQVHFIIGRCEGAIPAVDVGAVEVEIAQLARDWGDNLLDALSECYSASDAQKLFTRYGRGTNAAYREAYDFPAVICDLEHVETLKADNDLEVDFYRQQDDPADMIRLKLYHLGRPIPLSDRMPVLEHMGFHGISERSYRMERTGEDGPEVIWLHDITLEHAEGAAIDLDAQKPILQEAFKAIWVGLAEDDSFNRLVLYERIGWRDVTIVRAYARYLRQAMVGFGQDDIAETLARHGAITRQLVSLFHTRFDPNWSGATDRDSKQQLIIGGIEAALKEVASLDEDRILRHCMALIGASLRTNFYQRDAQGEPPPALAIKYMCCKLALLPEPKPYREIFVYSPAVEGLHLRFGAIARGGIRWSDRPYDFRTEVLGLVKAQQVKNAVIVPVGSKGGFYPKHLPKDGSREDVQEEAIRCYKIFIGALLDVTDNLDGETIVPPRDVIRHDGDDPYLVVAADKGTAKFSDIANEIALQRGFWLGDAFASGGRHGYDHKAMGITARGGWEAVKRHFREMDQDIQDTPFSVIGVGDMSGDVFGNGMLLSPQIRLIAVFDHRDIFIDPNPDPVTSFAERKRLFETPRTSWQDYDRALISEGGGVFSRSEKSIVLTDAIKKITGLKKAEATPDEILKGILKSKADLLWLGGIGTYIRCSDESHDEVGDRANDEIRITGSELRVKVVGEGANLGCTHRARIEFAAGGGRINTDAIDNSAGVNCSDQEVNIKIALAAALKAGRLDMKARNVLLAGMTDEVAALVLRNNYLQTLAITLEESQGAGQLEFQARFIRELESRGLLDRELEFLPSDDEIEERLHAERGLTRPELAVLAAYAKITLYNDLLSSDVLDDPYLAADLNRYFPKTLQKKFVHEIKNHRLRREIIATMLSNSIVNRGGITCVSRLIEETGADVAAVFRAYAIARDSFGLLDFSTQVNGLDNQVPAAVQLSIQLDMLELLRQRTVWFLRNETGSGGMADVISHYVEGIGILTAALDDVFLEDARTALNVRQHELIDQGVPEDLARQAALLRFIGSSSDIILCATRTGKPVCDVARIFYGLGASLGIDWLCEHAKKIKVSDYYDRLAVTRMREGLVATQRLLTRQILDTNGAGTEASDAWLKERGKTYELTRKLVEELHHSEGITMAKLAVASGQIHDLIN